MGFLISRRWLLFGLTVVLLAFGAVKLGEWQFHRLQDREQRNGFTATNLAADPAPVNDVLAVDRVVESAQEWTRVVAKGQYDDDATVVLRYQTRDGKSGVDVVTPLITDSGTGLLVDRGWVATENTGSAPPDIPAPPAGDVTVTGWVRADATGDSTDVTDGSTRAISSVAIGEGLAYDLYSGFVDLESQSPEADVELVPIELPDLGMGPHLFYGIQWWFFGALAVFGFGYLAYDERRKMVAARAKTGEVPGGREHADRGPSL